MERNRWFYFVVIPTLIAGICQLTLFVYLLALPVTLMGISENVEFGGMLVALVFVFYSGPMWSDLDAANNVKLLSGIGLIINGALVWLWFFAPYSNKATGLLLIVTMIACVVNVGGAIHFYTQNRDQVQQGENDA